MSRKANQQQTPSNKRAEKPENLKKLPPPMVVTKNVANR